MNNLQAFVEISENYLQFFDFTELNPNYYLPIENLELKGKARFISLIENNEDWLNVRLIFWEHNFDHVEKNFWFYLNMPKARLNPYKLWKKYFDITLTPLIIQGYFNFSEIIDTERDLFYRMIIKNEELQLQVKRSFFLEKNSNLSEIIKGH